MEIRQATIERRIRNAKKFEWGLFGCHSKFLLDERIRQFEKRRKTSTPTANATTQYFLSDAPRTIAFIYFEQWTCHLIRWKKIACCYQIDKILGLQLESFAVWLLICFAGVVVETANCHSKLYSWIFQSKLLCKFLHGSFIFFSTPFLSTQIDNWGMRSSATVYIAYKNRSQPYCNFC